MANLLYNPFKLNLLTGAIDLSTDPIYLMLVSGSYTFAYSHSVTGNITSEVTSDGYTKGGSQIANTTVEINTVTNEVVLSGSTLIFSGLTATPAYGIVWISGASPSTRYLLGQIDFGPQTLNNTDLVINWNSEGIFKF